MNRAAIVGAVVLLGAVGCAGGVSGGTGGGGGTASGGGAASSGGGSSSSGGGASSSGGGASSSGGGASSSGGGASSSGGGAASSGGGAASSGGGASSSGGGASSSGGGTSSSGGGASSSGGGTSSSGGGAPVDAGCVTCPANLFVDPNGGSCVRHPDGGVYVDAEACGSLQAAFSGCQPGDFIRVKAGVYAAQAVSGVKASPGCVIAGEPGAVIGPLSTSATFVTIASLTVDAGNGHAADGWRNSGNDVTVQDLSIRGAYASVGLSGSRVTWRGGELGTPGQTGGARSCNSADTEPVEIANADHVLIDGVTFHPQNSDPTPCAGSSNGFHLEMVRIDHDTSVLTLERSTFEDGDHSNTASVFITNVNGDPGDPTQLTFQNNFFGSADNTSFSVHQNVSNCSTFTWAYNTFHNTPGDPTANGCSTSAGMRWVGNLGPWPAFYSCAGTHVRNLWQDQQTFSCGSDGVQIGTRYGFNALGLDGGFHLQAGSPAIDRGEDGGYCLGALGARDHDGTARPRGAACDVGAHER
ncbi:MAG: hypothetical protein K1X89_08725 [Myxococcaceae bacterium]|nr:hypothetical protein [Myxococcaceae bacterium]